MKIEDVGKAIDLLYQYHYNDELLKKSQETQAAVSMLCNKIRNTNVDVEKFHYRNEIVDKIQKLLSHPHRDLDYDFKHNVLMYGLDVATTKLEYKLKELKFKIEKL